MFSWERFMGKTKKGKRKGKIQVKTKKRNEMKKRKGNINNILYEEQ